MKNYIFLPVMVFLFSSCSNERNGIRENEEIDGVTYKVLETGISYKDKDIDGRLDVVWYRVGETLEFIYFKDISEVEADAITTMASSRRSQVGNDDVYVYVSTSSESARLWQKSFNEVKEAWGK